MGRPTGAPPFEGAYVGVLDVSDADTNWHALTSDDFYTLNSGTVTDKLPAGLVLVGLAVDATADDGAAAFRVRAGDVVAGTGAGATEANSLKVAPGGSVNIGLRGVTGNPTAMSYRQGTISKDIQLVTFWDIA